MVKIKKKPNGMIYLEHEGKELPGLVSLFKITKDRYSLQIILEDETQEGIESGEGFSAEDQAQDDNEGKAEREAIQAKVEAQKVEVMKGVWVETRTDNL